MTETTISELARKDQLDIIYKERTQLPKNFIMTRSRSKERQRKIGTDLAEAATSLTEDLEDEEKDDLITISHSKKRVTFKHDPTNA